ncbi:MAG: amidohydrolase [Candidatus Marinimicrobia bacterium]|jgi:predicted amidohydrolase YtcJ|nr:amidohydrolase [Candidatus Neomarinimicrobiota bacterium]MBT4661100.1 amidohydrolase [Candidatus Neomarinimicrobiota bacterium]
MKKIIHSFVAIVALLLISFALEPSFTPKGSLYIYNGTVITLEDEQPKANAVFVDKGKIVAVGNDPELRLHLKETTKLIDLKGATLLPGFIDPHTHPVASSFLHEMIDLSGFRHENQKEIWTHLESEIKNYAPGEWIMCKGLDVVLVDDLEPPHITYLDSISPNNPLLILSLSMHSFWGNSLAFNAAGINKNSPNPSESSFYGKDASGSLNGYISEQAAFQPFRDTVINAMGKVVLKEKCVTVLDEYAANGNTCITSMGITTNDPNVIRLYQHLSSEQTSLLNKVLQRLGLLPRRKPTVRNFVFVRDDADYLLPFSPNNGDDFFKMAGVKFWYDGSPYTGSMYLNEPFKSSSVNQEKIHVPLGHSGKALWKNDEIANRIKQYDSVGWQVAVHTQGDRAISETLDAFEKSGIPKNSRHRLEHCLLPSKKAIQRMVKLGVSPSFHINHLWYYGEALENHIIGRERTDKILPLKAAENNSLIFSLHADQPMFESDPLSLLHTAVNRKTRYGNLFGKSNKIGVEQGLKSLTINAAWQIKMENKIGSIKPGKYADFVILDQNPMMVDPEKIKDIHVLQTIVNGNIVYKKD